MSSPVGRRSWLALALLLATLTAVCCQQRQRVAVETPEPRSPDWDSGLAVDLGFDVTAGQDTVDVVARATAKNITKTTRELCVNLRFVAGFRQPTEESQQPDESNAKSVEFKEIPDSLEIESSEWKKDGKRNCTPRTLEPGASFQEQFRFRFAKSDLERRGGDVVVVCQIWFQTRLDIPNRSLTCDLDHFAYEAVPER